MGRRKKTCIDCGKPFRAGETEKRCFSCFARLVAARRPEFVQELAAGDERRKALERAQAQGEATQADPEADRQFGAVPHREGYDPRPILCRVREEKPSRRVPIIRPTGP